MESLFRLILTLAQPLCLVWLVLTFVVVGTLWRRQWWRAFLPTFAWLILTALTCTPLASFLLAGLENRYSHPSEADIAGADAIVCLGGGIQPSLTEPTGLHLVRGSDRMATALSMAIQGRAPVLVLGGGGTEEGGKRYSEADAVQSHLRKFPDVKFEIISLGICAHTRDEAVKVAKLAQERGWKKVLLVTSASHMPRSVATFAKVGVPVTAVPCHYLSSYNRIGDVRLLHLPSYGSFELFDSWLHEALGSMVYSWRGWM